MIRPAAGPGSARAPRRAAPSAAGSTRAGPRCRGAGRVEDRVRVGAARRSGRRTSPTIVVGHLGHDAQVVRDHDRRPSELALEPLDQLEDLRLDGHVQRRRRLVGDQQLAARWPAPSRSSRAGACRPRTRAGSCRARCAASGMPTSSSISTARSRAAPSSSRRCASGTPRRSACPPCRRGAATTAGPGRSSPRRCRAARAAVARPSRGRPRRRTAPGRPGVALRARVRPITVRPVTLLPEPDSPTIPSVRPSSTLNDTPSTACTTPSSVANWTLQVHDLEQRAHAASGDRLTRAPAAGHRNAPADRAVHRRCRRRGWP